MEDTSPWTVFDFRLKDTVELFGYWSFLEIGVE